MYCRTKENTDRPSELKSMTNFSGTKWEH